MEKLSGLVLDRYDDSAGLVKQELSRRYEEVGRSYSEELEKRAQTLTPEELSALPDPTFALVIQDGESTLRKFSMADSGNLGISVLYFLQTGHRLPIELQKSAAQNLVNGCGWYGVEPPEELKKVALGVGALMGAVMVPGAAREAKNNLNAARGTGGAIMTPGQIKAQRLQTGV